MSTIKDVAQEAGVSPSTVSRTLHDSSLISRETKEKIWQAMKKLNYSPNFAAQNLANQTSNVIGVILPPDTYSVANNPFFGQILQGIASICNQYTYMVSLATGKDDHELIQNIKMMIEQGRVERFIVTYSQQNDQVLDYLEQNHIMHVLIGKPEQSSRTTFFVNNDNISAGEDVTDYLFQQGYHSPAFIYEDLEKIVQKDRFNGYSKAMNKQKLAPLGLKVSKGYPSNELQHFIEQHPEVDSLVACDDIMGINMQNELLALHYRPSDYGIISFNNSLFARVSHPSITSVEIFPTSLGEKAAEMVLDVGQDQSQSMIVPHRIVERESTKLLKNHK